MTEPNSMNDIQPEPAATSHTQQLALVEAAVKAVFDSSGIEMKSVISQAQFIHIVRLRVYAEIYECPLADKIADMLLQLAVSNKGRGRNDLQVVLKALLSNQDQEEKKSTMLDRLIGRGG